jgi:hypothetical protein
MKKGTAAKERRRHLRSSVPSGVVAVLISSAPEIIGSVRDISLGGAKITYHDLQNSEVDYTGLKVDLISDDRLVEAIPCSNAWDAAVVEEGLVAAGDLRQCGIQFGGLNQNQLYLLQSFISRCAEKGEAPSISQ